MLKEAEGNLVEDNTYDIFCHQVNCRGVMGAGIAAQIRNKYPEVYDAYRRRYVRHLGAPSKQLGSNLLVRTNDGRICVNMYGQDRYGKYEQYTEYTAFARCIIDLADKVNGMDASLKIGFPDHIGCGHGGGSWNTIREMISTFANRIKQDVFIVKLKG